MNRTWLSGVVLLVMAACEPGSVTEARDQLGRKASGFLELLLPVVDTSYFVAELLPEGDTLTLPGNILGLRVQADTLQAVEFSQFLVSTEVSTALAFPGPALSTAAPGDARDTLSFQTSQGTQITGGTIATGWVVRSISNNTGCTGTVDVTVVDSIGSPIVAFAQATVADGASLVDSASLAGVVVSGFMDLETTGTFQAPCVPNPLGEVSTLLTVRPLSLSQVTVDNVSETIAVEEIQAIDNSQVDFDDLGDAIGQSTLNNATVDLTVVNSADLPVVIDNFVLGLVQLDGAGQPLRDGGGNLMFEQGGSGPILIPIADAGVTTFALGRQATKNVVLNAAALADRLVHLVLDDSSVALVATGDATAGDGTAGVLTAQDFIEVQYDFAVGLDFTIPPTGVVFTRTQTVEGMDLDSADIQDIQNRLESLAIEAVATNNTPFGVTIALALVADSLDETVDVFVQPGAVLLSPVVLGAPTVDASGMLQAPVTDAVSLAISGTDAPIVLGRIFTVGLRFTLLPGMGAGGRGAIPSDGGVGVDAAVRARVRRGG